MAIVDVEKIIQGTPTKRILNAYRHTKETYSKDSALDYYYTYTKESLSDIFENSKYIFSEPYYGLSFYLETVKNPNYCTFSRLENEIKKVEKYILENRQNMSEEQLTLYTEAVSDLVNTLYKRKNLTKLSHYIKESIDPVIETKISDTVYDIKNNRTYREDLYEAVKDIHPIAFFTYSPFFKESLNQKEYESILQRVVLETAIPEEYNEEKWKNFIEAVFCINLANKDKEYKESVLLIPRKYRTVYDYYLENSFESIDEDLKERCVKESSVVYESSELAVNSLFDDILEYNLRKDYYEKEKSEIENYENIMNEVYENFLDSFSFHDFSIFTEKRDFSNVKDDEDVSDDDIDSIGEDDDKDDKDDNDDEEKGEYDRLGKIDNVEKIKAPKPENLTVGIQNKAMDLEAQELKGIAKVKKKGQEILNAGKAVVQIPKNVLDEIKKIPKTLDDMDDERRKQYMSKPGFRKKIFHNLHLAILYGTVATVKLSMLPVVLVLRMFSKEKNKRIQNELIRELETEIKVCEEKIQDASKNDKYRLMRIKEQLEAEKVRVAYNSRYI